MLNSIKKQLFDILLTLTDAHKEIISKLESKNTFGFTDFLAECQNVAIQIGETIEQLEGSGTNTVSLLEAYCDYIYLLNQTLDTTSDNLLILETLNDFISKIESGIRNEFPTKFEILFFPYKASMWDSMESIWKASNSDPSIDAYVIPIPYFDINADRTYGKMHYEGNEYPSYVPIHSWQSYFFKERRPDAIFIHNPYDGANFATRVHSDFYASNLKKYTDLLIYIPYFVAADDITEEFCILPATIYADKVILQSNKIRDSYVKHFTKWVHAEKYEHLFPNIQDKFLALGSPKFDKVLTTTKESCNIPESWLPLMKNADGSDRKIIFYNTTLSALLSQNEKALDKLEYVFNFFKNNSDILLLWRPHPLIFATYTSMRPLLLKRYTALVEQFKSEGWGIYDDSTDMNRAIALSDAYYGDQSSIVELYRLTNKPIMIQNFEITNGE